MRSRTSGTGSIGRTSQTLQLPADDTSCALCVLFAGGSNAIASGSADALRLRRGFRGPAGRNIVACGLLSHLVP